MRVGLVIYGSLDTISGGYLYDRLLVRYLERQGDQVEIISLPWRNYSRHLLDNLSADFLRRMRGEFDVLLQDELNHPSLAWANDRLDTDRPPIVAIVHHLRSSEAWPDWQLRFYLGVERRYLQSVDAFIYNSRTTQRVVERMLGGTRPHVVAYPGGDRLSPSMTGATVGRRAKEGPLRLVFAGNIIPRKGLHVLLAALARVRADWRLSVAGNPAASPAYYRAVRRQAEGAGLDGRIEWCGGLNDDDLAARMDYAHALIGPSVYEGFGIVYMEGMGFGLPAVATMAGGASEIITDGVNGYLIAPGDVEGLAARLESLAGDRDLLARLGEAALDTYKRHPSWEATAASIREFLVGVARGSEE